MELFRYLLLSHKSKLNVNTTKDQYLLDNNLLRLLYILIASHNSLKCIKNFNKNVFNIINSIFKKLPNSFKFTIDKAQP